jgi:predicted RNase H-like HicB family nuclease
MKIKIGFPEIWEERPKFSEKIRDIIIYFTFSMEYLSLIRLVKLIYLSEFYSINLQKRRITDAKFYKYYYGPWSPDIEYTSTIIAGDEILMVEQETKEGHEGVFFVPNVEKVPVPTFSSTEIQILKNVITDWKYVPSAVLIKLCKSPAFFTETEFGGELKIEELLKKKELNVLGYEVRLEEEEKFYFVECPSLPGCVSQGETEEEALEGIKNAIIAYIECVAKLEKEE